MIRGTTPTLKFIFKYTLDFLFDYDITFSQNGNVLLVKTKNDIEIDGNIIKVRLSEEDTLLFDNEQLLAYQIRGKTKNGDTIASYVKYCYVSEILNEVILT